MNVALKVINKKYPYIVGFAGLIILLFGIYLIMRQTSKVRQNQNITPAILNDTSVVLSNFPLSTPNVESNTSDSIKQIIASIKEAKPKFELGYTIMALEKFKNIVQMSNKNENDLFAFKVLDNDITERIQTNNPSVNPDYGLIDNASFINSFIKEYREKKVKLLKVNIGCLVVRQLGKGVADSVVIDNWRVDFGLRKTLEIVDGTDIDIIGNYAKKYSGTKMEFSLGTMNTAYSVLIPLFVSNYFIGSGQGEGREYQMVSYAAYVPLLLSYYDKNKRMSISLDEILNKPLDVN